jgi:glycosyltransferase involved in cell wall biosynthesis
VRVVVATVVHHPFDARIFYRQIGSLLDAGHEVVYLAPFENGSEPVRMGLRCRRLPRSTGRSRLGPLRAAARLLAEETASADLAILHDPELTLLNRYVGCRAVWDVHEDLHAQVADKDWIPGSLRGPARLGARLLERRAGRRFDLMLAEPGYQSRFDGGTVIRNTPVVPETVVESVDPRIVYVGRVSLGRGLETMLRSMELVDPVHTLHLYGPVDPAAGQLLRGLSPSIVAHGFVDGPVALRSIEGATVGLSLLRDLPNYRHSLPTKVLEYLAHGIPVITTPLPEARRIVEDSGGGIVVPFDDPDAVAGAIIRMASGSFRRECADNGRRAVRDRFDWSEDASRMMVFLEQVAAGTDR